MNDYKARLLFSIALISVVVFGFVYDTVHRYKAEVEREAIKAGLSQDPETGHWVKP